MPLRYAVPASVTDIADRVVVTQVSTAARCHTRRHPSARSMRAASPITTGSKMTEAYLVALASNRTAGTNSSHFALLAALTAEYAAKAVSIRDMASNVA